MRSVIGAVVGVVVGAVVIFIVEGAGHRVFPPPPGVNLNDPAALKSVMDQIPFGAKAAVLVGWFLGVVAGSVAALLIAQRWAPVAWVVTASLFGLAAVTMATIPHPLWMTIGAVVLSALGGWLAIKLARGTYARPPKPPEGAFNI